jgi:hypothetical protein
MNLNKSDLIVFYFYQKDEKRTIQDETKSLTLEAGEEYINIYRLGALGPQNFENTPKL